MKWIFAFLFLIAFTLPACSAQSFTLDQGANQAAPANETADAVVKPSGGEEVQISEDAGGYARAFYRAWEANDYLGMYSLLAPQSQALVDSASFVARYDEAMKTAAVQQVSAQPVSLMQEGDTAEFGVLVTWDTAVMGPISRDYTVPLVYDDGRWGIVWDEGLILPELAGGNRLSMETVVPSRASIYDIGGYALAYQGRAIGLGIIPGQIQDEAGMLAALAPILEKEPDEIKEMYAAAEPDWYVPIVDIQ
jgi:penicillin-binding protein 2